MYDKKVKALLEELQFGLDDDFILKEDDDLSDTNENMEDDIVDNDDAQKKNSNGLTPMQKLMVVCMMYQYNFRIMHWKSFGKHFDSVHAVMSEYYEELTKKLDDIAEFCMMQGVLPITLEDVTNYKDKIIKVDMNENFNEKNGYEKAIKMLNHLSEVIELAREGCTKDINAELDTFQYWCRKEATYKCKRRLMED